MSARGKALGGLTVAWLAICLATCLAWAIPAPAEPVGTGPAKGAPDCCPDLSPYYPRNQAAPPAKAKEKKKKKRVPAEPAVKVDKPWSTVETQGQEAPK